MKIVFVDTYYQGFLNDFWLTNRNLVNTPYERQLKSLTSQDFGTADFYSKHLRKLGHSTHDIIANAESLQRKWAEENHLNVSGSSMLDKLRLLPFLHLFLGRPSWVQEIVIAQITKLKPDVVYMQDLSILTPKTLSELKRHCSLLVGQIACPLPPQKNLLSFDLLISSLPNYVYLFKKMGIKSEYLKLAFESDIARLQTKTNRIYDVSFIGSFTPHHSKGAFILEQLAGKIPINVWGQGINFLSPNSPLRKNYHGKAWGKEMFKILSQSKIVVNRHISISGKFANNMRLFEATGMGALLITDRKSNLGEIFEVGKEVVDYSNLTDLVQKVQYYLSHPVELERISKSGQRRTLETHNYSIRMKELEQILLKYLK